MLIMRSDLGIDSVTFTVAITDLLTTFKLDPTMEIETCQTLAEIVQFFEKVVQQEHGEAWADQITSESTAGLVNTYIDKVKQNVTSTDTVALDGDLRTMRDFVGIKHADLFQKTREFSQFYRHKKANNLYWYGMPLESACANRAVMFDEVSGTSREFLMFGSNSYLGLSNHPEVIRAIQEAAQSYGATNTGCRLIAGSNVLHLELEKKLAQMKGREGCIVLSFGIFGQSRRDLCPHE
ncbi:aminotransferase class I/II-fold pyridoxal phosphate-dependent enzyme [Vibrio sp. PP-XX7]